MKFTSTFALAALAAFSFSGCYFMDMAQCSEKCDHSIRCTPQTTEEVMKALGQDVSCEWKEDSTEAELKADCNEACMKVQGELDGDEKADTDAYWTCYKEAVGDLTTCDAEDMVKASGDTCKDEAGKSGQKKYGEKMNDEFKVDDDVLECK